MKTTGNIQNTLHTIGDNLEHVWNMLTDDEDMCYESNDKKFYQTLKQKYGISREEISYIRSLP